MLIVICILFIIYCLIINYKVLKEEENCIYIREFPSNDKPAFVGKIVKGKIDGNDIVATILELERKNIIKISLEQINGKNEKILTMNKEIKSLELEEEELFLINKIFKNNKKILFKDYIKSKKFKNDFKAFDDMISRKIDQKKLNKESKIRNINKIIFISIFLTFGITIFYSILNPFISIISINTNIKIIVNIILSAIIQVVIAKLYINYISKKSLIRENINLKISYIFISIILVLIFCYDYF